jgi:hypothetical protein
MTSARVRLYDAVKGVRPGSRSGTRGRTVLAINPQNIALPKSETMKTDASV